jgi:hypothetical protein
VSVFLQPATPRAATAASVRAIFFMGISLLLWSFVRLLSEVPGEGRSRGVQRKRV